jgi:hypothetical protein
MLTNRQYHLVTPFLFSVVAGLSCSSKTADKPAMRPNDAPVAIQAVNNEVATGVADKAEYFGKPYDANRKSTFVGKITFTVRDPERAKDGPSSYVSVDNPGMDIKHMDNPNEIVVPSIELYVVVDYPVKGKWEFKITSSNPNGFTRAGLATEISHIYHSIYDEEERTTKAKVIPADQRKTTYNRNRTDGKYGIWGHDIGDLALHDIELHKTVDGKLYAILGIDS